MVRKLRVSFAGVCLSAVFVLASCTTARVHRHPGRGVGHGPPAHARAHGYRHKHVCGYELVYDAGCGVYVVVGMSDCYYHNGHFYRLRGSVWEISLRADRWSTVAHASLPPGLRAKSKAKVARGIKAQARPTGGGKAKVEIQAQARPSSGGKVKAEIQAQAKPNSGGKAKAETKAQAKPTGKGKGKGYAKGKGKS